MKVYKETKKHDFHLWRDVGFVTTNLIIYTNEPLVLSDFTQIVGGWIGVWVCTGLGTGCSKASCCFALFLMGQCEVGKREYWDLKVHLSPAVVLLAPLKNAPRPSTLLCMIVQAWKAAHAAVGTTQACRGERWGVLLMEQTTCCIKNTSSSALHFILSVSYAQARSFK